MVAFNFKEEFAPKIEAGEKISTIRKTARCKAGDKMQLYTGQRTKNSRKIAEKTCIAVVKICIDRDTIWSFPERRSEDKPLPVPNRRLHEMEGFMNAKEMVDFFEDHYGLPFIGYWHVWEDQKEKISPEIHDKG